MTAHNKIEFSFQEKIKLKGTGSPRIEYKTGIIELDNLKNQGASIHFVNLEILSNGLLLRSTKIRTNQTIFIERDNISELYFWVKRYKVWGYFIWWIKYDGTLTIKMTDKVDIEFFIPQVYFSPFKKFIHKSWLIEKLNYQVDPAPPEIIRNSILMGIFNR